MRTFSVDSTKFSPVGTPDASQQVASPAWASRNKFTNPMLEVDQLGDGGEKSPPRASDQVGRLAIDGGNAKEQLEEPLSPKQLSPRAEPKTKSRIVHIETAEGTLELDMNLEYTLGSQKWYLKERRLVHEKHGRYAVVETDETDKFIGAVLFQEIWLAMTSGGNLAAGVASALHVNIYLLAVGLLLSSPYMGIMTVVRLAVSGTLIQQLIATLFSSFGNYAIANCDTVPAAIFVNVITHVVSTVENEHLVETRARHEMARQVALLGGGNASSSELAGSDTGVSGLMDRRLGESAVAGSDDAALARQLCLESGPDGNYVDGGCYDRVASTILCCTMVTGLAVGFIMMAMGTKIKAGPLVSFIPITVQSAFLAGCGGSIFKKGLKFMVDMKLLTATFGGGLQQIFLNCGPVLAMAAFVIWAEHRLHHTKYGRIALPGLLLGLSSCFYIVVAINWMADPDLHSWSDAIHDIQQPNKYNSSFPPLDASAPPYGRGWLLDPVSTDGIDDSGAHHPFGEYAWNTIFLPQFTHFRMTRTRPDTMRAMTVGVTSTWNATTDMPISSMKVQCANSHTINEDGYEELNLWHELDQACYPPKTEWIIMWSAIFNAAQCTNIIVMAVITLLCILLNSAAIEEETEQDVDFDQELFSVGLGNVLCGAAGGFVGYCSVAKTMLCHSMGGHQKAGVFAVAYYVGYWFVLFAFARFIPLPVLGAFICAIGLELVLEWTLHMKHKVSESEMYEILGLTALMMYSFVGGFMLGMLMALVSFTAKYTSTPVIRSILDGSEYQGSATRSKRDEAILSRYASEIITLRLQGFIFFFTAEKLRKSIISVHHSFVMRGQHVTYMILDFRMVDEVDTTAVKKIKKLLRYTNSAGLHILITNVTNEMAKSFDREGVHAVRTSGEGHHAVQVGYDKLSFFEQADEAVEWCADQLCARTGKNMSFCYPDPAKGRHTVKTIARGVLTNMRFGFKQIVQGNAFDTVTFRELGQRTVYNKGDMICAQGSGKDSFYFIAEGSILMMREMGAASDVGGGTKRLEKRYAGTIFSELSFFLRKKRHCSFIADLDGTEIFEYSRASFSELEVQSPVAAEALMTYVMNKLADTIKRLTRENHLLLRDNRELVNEEGELVEDAEKEVSSSEEETEQPAAVE